MSGAWTQRASGRAVCGWTHTQHVQVTRQKVLTTGDMLIIQQEDLFTKGNVI